MENKLYTLLYISIALLVSLAGFLELKPVAYCHTQISDTITEIHFEQFSYETDFESDPAALHSRVRTNFHPSPTSRIAQRVHTPQRIINTTTIKVGKTINIRSTIAHYMMRWLLPVASKNKNELIILIHRLCIEP